LPALQDKAPVLGVVHVPVTGQTYYAVAGKGAYLREADGSSRQIHCKEFAIGQPGLEVVGSASHANPTNNSGGLRHGGAVVVCGSQSVAAGSGNSTSGCMIEAQASIHPVRV
jgi:fructose-1,6-bisphosphatase/inositol monophosphatase family enzyme